MWIAWPEPEAKGLIVLSSHCRPLILQHIIFQHHTTTENSPLSCGEMLHVREGKKEEGRKRKNNCKCLIMSFGYFPSRKKELLGLEHTLQERESDLSVVGSFQSPASGSNSAISSHLFSMVGPRYLTASLCLCFGDCFHAGRRGTNPAVQRLPPSALLAMYHHFHPHQPRHAPNSHAEPYISIPQGPLGREPHQGKGDSPCLGYTGGESQHGSSEQKDKLLNRTS